MSDATRFEINPAKTGWLREEIRRIAQRSGLAVRQEERSRMVLTAEAERTSESPTAPETSLVRFLDSLGGEDSFDAVTVKVTQDSLDVSRAALSRRGYLPVEDAAVSIVGNEDFYNSRRRGSVIFETIR